MQLGLSAMEGLFVLCLNKNELTGFFYLLKALDI